MVVSNTLDACLQKAEGSLSLIEQLIDLKIEQLNELIDLKK